MSEHEPWQTREELHAHFGPGGPVAAIRHFLRLIHEAQDFPAAWRMMDDNLRLCRAQAWLWDNRNSPDVAVFDLANAADAIAKIDSRHPLWGEFPATELRQLLGVPDMTIANLGAASRPRPIDVDLELVIVMRTGGEPLMFDSETLLTDALPYLMRSTDAGWVVAAYGDRLPEPGWPPKTVL
jgi:hypothetical protein